MVNSLRRIAASNSRNAVNFSSARTTKRFPSPRCASTIQVVRPLESIAETQPQLHPALLRLSAMISQYFNGGQNEVSACRNDSLAAKLAPLSRVSIHISFGDMAEDAPAQMTVKTDLGGVTVTDLLGGMTITDLGVLPIGNAMRTSIAQRINRKGQVVGSSECGGERHAF